MSVLFRAPHGGTRQPRLLTNEARGSFGVPIGRPRLLEHLRLDVIDGFGVQVTARDRVRHFEGEVFECLGHMLEEGLSTEEILARARGEDERLELTAALVILAEDGIVTEEEPVPVGREAAGAYWRALGASPRVALEE